MNSKGKRRSVSKVFSLIKRLYDRFKVLAIILAGYLLPSTKKVKLLIFAQGRSGSTLLESLLCSTGYFSKQGEPLGIYNHVLWRPLDFIRGYAKLKKGENFLCHVKIYQLVTSKKTFEDPGKFVSTLQKKGWKVIFLRRENIANQVISSHIGASRKGRHRNIDHEDQFQYYLDLKKFELEVEERKSWFEKEKQIFSKIPHLALTYEKDLSDLQKQKLTIGKILEFLGLPPRPSYTHYRKTNESNLPEVLINYEEYKQLLQDRGWEKYLDSPDTSE